MLANGRSHAIRRASFPFFLTVKAYLSILALLLPGLSSCTTGSGTANKSGSVQHIVLAWLKKPGDETGRARLIAASKDLKAKIPQVRSLVAGPVLPSERAIVDDSFDVALVMTFDSPDAMAAYEKSPVHVQAVKDTLKPLTSKIVVYDFVAQ